MDGPGTVKSHSGVRGYSDIGEYCILVAIHVLPWTVRVTLDSKVEARPDMALLDITHLFTLR